MAKQVRIKLSLIFFLVMMVSLSRGYSQSHQTEPARDTSPATKKIDNDPHATGLLLPTEEELEWMDRNMIKTRAVRLNQLGLERINKFRAERGVEPLKLKETEVAEFGKEAIGQPKAEEKAGMASGENTAPPASEPRELPDSVDNSELLCFPPIRSQGSLGSCASFAVTYYGMTHMVGLVRGWDNHNEDNTTKFSPKWTFNMLNGSTPSGSGIGSAIS